MEEGGKYFVLKHKTWRHPAFNYTFDAVVYAVTAALGFAVAENILYVMDGGVGVALLRAAVAVPGHAFDGVFMGYYYGIAKTAQLAPGASEVVTFSIDPYTLASFNEDSSAWETAAGNYLACFGASAADIRATAAFKEAKSLSWPAHRALIPETPSEEIKVK